MFKYLISILFVLAFLPGKAQQTKPVSELDTLSLQYLMNIKLTVASAKELTPRESPGIVSYITAEDIRKVGARDLMDVLNSYRVLNLEQMQKEFSAWALAAIGGTKAN